MVLNIILFLLLQIEGKITNKGKIFHPWQSFASSSSPYRHLRSFREELLSGSLSLKPAGNVDTVCIDRNGDFLTKNFIFHTNIYIDKEQIESLLKNLHDKDSVQLKYSHVVIQDIDKETAKILAMYGNSPGIFINSNGKKEQIKSGKHDQKTWIEK